MNSISLEKFNIEELQIVIAHLRLGTDHLKKQLTPEQLKNLEKYATISGTEKKEFEVTKIEKLSHLCMLYNSVITGALGVWMGIAGALQLDVPSKVVQVGIFSFLSGSIIGAAFLSVHKKKSQQALFHQKIQKLACKAFEAIYKKQKEKLNEFKVKFLKRYEIICDEKPTKIPQLFEKKEDFFSWFYIFHQSLHLKFNEFSQDPIFIHYKEQALQILKQTEQTYVAKAELIGNFNYYLNNQKEETKNAECDPLEVLTDPSLSTPKFKIKKIPWYKQEIFDLLFAFFPTLLGALGSILMWCNSTFIFAPIFNMLPSAKLLPDFCIPHIKIAISLLFTSSFLFFYYYSQRKNYQRTYNNEFKKKELLNLETKVLQMNQRLNLVLFLDLRLEEIMKYLEYSKIIQKNYKN